MGSNTLEIAVTSICESSRHNMFAHEVIMVPPVKSVICLPPGEDSSSGRTESLYVVNLAGVTMFYTRGLESQKCLSLVLMIYAQTPSKLSRLN